MALWFAQFPALSVLKFDATSLRTQSRWSAGFVSNKRTIVDFLDDFVFATSRCKWRNVLSKKSTEAWREWVFFSAECRSEYKGRSQKQWKNGNPIILIY